MKVKIKSKQHSASDVATFIRSIFAVSRFTIHELFTVSANEIKINKVRLNKAKSYCGNHPNACEQGNAGGHIDPKRTYLEGADWVEFNDLLNDCLDRLEVSANVSSVSCILRRETKRRISYESIRQFNAWQWDRMGDVYRDYKDCIGKDAPNSYFPEGTPGIYKDIYNEVG